ncbi:lactonase family protein [Lacibacter luteus]|uniref:Lactonase family protein n=1 Tax=Lacibacter luteus TaxID=2508719 RepID=A0A4Q1CMC2_9BACT|nr:lactonase family protein [Lacibacter luteus]RXK61841.1 lactonase family protein [Lacibacter luteus]
MKLFLPLSLLLCFSLKAQQYHLLVGTYTNAGSEGIYTYKFDVQTGKTTANGSVKTTNPSYLAVSPDQKYVFAVNENDSGTVSAFKFNKENGALTFLNTVTSAGAHPCYISVNKKGTVAVAGNYSSGTIAVMEIRSDGQLSQPKQIIQLKGSSVNRSRQEKSHVHATVFSPDFRHLLVPDLGTDKVMLYSVAPNSGALQAMEEPYADVNAGAGPRHIDFHPKLEIAYLIEELTGTISVFKYKEGQLELLQNTSSHPLSYIGAFGSADIHVSPDGRFLYASNRGDANSIAIFSIDQETGMLQIAGFQPTLGIHPRNFSIDPTGNFLLVANRDSDEIVIFRIDKKTGLLDDTKQRINVSKPVCVKWIVTK